MLKSKWFAKAFEAISKPYHKAVERLFSRVFRRQLQVAASRLERLEAEMRGLKQRQMNIELAAVQVKVGAKLSPKGGAWVVVAYTVGEREYVNFYDFRNSNMNALRDFLEKFVKAGMAVRLATPFERAKKEEA